MKKLLPLVLLIFAPILSFGQLFSEDFSNLSGALPAGWTVIDGDGLTPSASVSQFTSAWIIAADFDNAADTCALSNSWYTPAGTSNDWLITPQITLTANNLLKWEAESQDALYLETYEVRISTTTPTITGFTANPALTTITNENGAVWTQRSVAIPATYDNQAVYIAWRNVSTDEFVLMVDDISITTVLPFDASIANADTSEYTQIPLPQAGAMIFAGEITNNGYSAVTNVTMKVNVLNSLNANVFTATSTAQASLAAGVTSPFTVTGFTPTIADVYTIEFINQIAEADSDMSNDTTSYLIAFTDSVYARDDNTVTGTLGIGAGTAGELGQNFTLDVSDTITSVSFQIGNANGIMTGQPMFARVYATDVTGTPTTVVATTDTVIINSALDSLWTVPITGDSYVLPAGTFAVVVQELDSNITIATTDDIFTLGTTWVRFGTTPWTNNEGFNFNVSYILRANFGTPPPCIPTAGQMTASSCTPYTSPSGNYVWSTTGTYMDTLTNAAGCDSVITVNLTIGSYSSSSISVSACGPYTSPSGSYVWSTSGTYMDTIPLVGCDSVITVTLTINAPSSSQTTASACGPYTSPSGNYVWSASGTYMDTIPNAAGCDSVMTVTLSITTVNVTTSTSGATITASAAGATYQWVDCDAAFAIISGQTSQAFTPVADGNYAVIVTENGCSDTSTCVPISFADLEEIDNTSLTLFPNPSNGEFVIEFQNGISGDVDVQILSMDGKVVYSKASHLSSKSNELAIDASSINSGYYVVNIVNDNKLMRKPIVIK